MFKPLSKLMREFMLQRPFSLEWLLFGCYLTLNDVRQNVISQLHSETAVPPVKKTSSVETAKKQKSKENLTKVYQTVRCK